MIAVRAHPDAARRWCASRPGRTELSREAQLLCLYAGANSIFYGDKLLTTPNPDEDEDALAHPRRRPRGDGPRPEARRGELVAR